MALSSLPRSFSKPALQPGPNNYSPAVSHRKPFMLAYGNDSCRTRNHCTCQYYPHQQKKRLLQTDRARVRTACVRPIRSIRSKHPPLRPVRPERPERPGVLGLHLLRLVPPNTLVPVLTTRRTCHGLIPSEHPPAVSSRPGVSRVDLPDSGSPTA